MIYATSLCLYLLVIKSLAYENVYDESLARCSETGMALTGYTRTGSCVDYNDDAGSHHICIDLSSTTTPENFCQVTGQSNWCASEMACDGTDGNCPVENWCVCQWAFSSYIAAAGGCDQIQDIVCDAINMEAVTAYTSSSDPNHAVALACIQERCGLLEDESTPTEEEIIDETSDPVEEDETSGPVEEDDTSEPVEEDDTSDPADLEDGVEDEEDIAEEEAIVDAEDDEDVAAAELLEPSDPLSPAEEPEAAAADSNSESKWTGTSIYIWVSVAVAMVLGGAAYCCHRDPDRHWHKLQNNCNLESVSTAEGSDVWHL